MSSITNTRDEMAASPADGKAYEQATSRQASENRLRAFHRRGTIVLVSLGLLTIVMSLISAGTGQVTIHPDQAITILMDEFNISLPFEVNIRVGDGTFNIPAEYDSPRQDGTLLSIRLPRVILGLLIGASLAAGGTLIQGMFRNPLADPGLIGISGGAAFAAALVIVMGNMAAIVNIADWLAEMSIPLLPDVLRAIGEWQMAAGIPLLPVGAFLGGLLTTFAIYRIATINGRTSVATMLLAGIALNALAGAGIGMLISRAQDVEIRDITFWNLGSLVGTTWDKVEMALPFILLALLPMLFLARPLNALLLGDMEAEHLGYNVERVKQMIVVIAAVAVGAGVAVAGIISFVGLVVPHLTRMLVGPDHRYVIPGSALLGGALLVTADLFARTNSSGEIPLGVVTALIGAPFFIYLLLRDRRRGTLA
ncbi:MAG: FecCD family ABC transporter permease [Chloroflexota bacterium]